MAGRVMQDRLIRVRIAPGPGVTMTAAGAACVVLGGLVAAVAAPLAFADGSWLAAYLVLVGGVAQVAIGIAPTQLRARPVAAWMGWMQVVCWNLGNAGVIAGTLAGTPVLVDAGSVLLLVALVLAVRGTARPAVRGVGGRIAVIVYRVVLAVLLVSIPVGIVLSYLRHG